MVAQAAIGDIATNQFLAATLGIHIGGVDEVAASIDIGMEDGLRNLIGRTPSRGAEGHGAEGERADDQAGVSESAEGGKAHRFLFWLKQQSR